MQMDPGFLDNKSPEEVQIYMEELGLRFEYGCHSLGQWYENFKKMSEKSLEIFSDNCMQRNFGDSCFKYAAMKLTGNSGIRRDPIESFHAFQHGCKIAKHGNCCQGAGRLAAEGMVSHAPTFETAIQFFELGCKSDTPLCCFHLGGAAMALAQKTGDGEESRALRLKALKAWTQGCKFNDVLSCRNVATMYRKGDGVEVDQSKFMEFDKRGDELWASRTRNKSE